jgi:hypothetical protein
VAERGYAAGEQIQQQRPVGVLVERIERRIAAGEDLVGVGDVAEIIPETEADEEDAPERDGGEQDERELEPPARPEPAEWRCQLSPGRRIAPIPSTMGDVRLQVVTPILFVSLLSAISVS